MVNSAINNDELLVAITAAQPSGIDVRANVKVDSLYYKLRQAVSQARDAERMRIKSSVDTIVLASEWRDIKKLAIKILVSQSKDLEVASWLIEANIRLDGFLGFADGFRFIASLVDTFKKTLFPKKDGKSFEAQLAAIAGLSGQERIGTLVMPLLSIPITSRESGSIFASWQYKQAKASNPKLLETIKNAAKSSEGKFSHQLYEELTTAMSALTHCEKVFTKYYAKQCPSFSHLDDTLIDIKRILETLYKSVKENDEAEQAKNGKENKSLSKKLQKSDTAKQQAILKNKRATSDATKPKKWVSKSSQKKAMSDALEREEALGMIAQAADYFANNEQHSPVSYLLQQAVRWADMALPDLMRELMEDQPYHHYCKLTGIPTSESDKNSVMSNTDTEDTDKKENENK